MLFDFKIYIIIEEKSKSKHTAGFCKFHVLIKDMIFKLARFWKFWYFLSNDCEMKEECW